MSQLAGKVVLVTGAGKGLGRLTAQALAAHGALVAANDISPLNLDAVVETICAAGGTARAYCHDVAKKVAVQAMLNNVTDEFGRLDILVNSANVEPSGSLLDIDEWDLHRIFDVNTIGAILMLQSAGRVMRAQGGGMIVNLVKFPAELNRAAYAASRLAIAGLTMAAAPELAAYHIHLHAVTLGLPQLAEPGAVFSDPVEAVLALCSGQFATETGKIINIGSQE
jgi:NAD(P)-dependent dehydrogenase (short-subunit alcohol dehydrogenase family)